MIPERYRQIRELYHVARAEGTADERVALLAQADPELRCEVESLLAVQVPGEFMDRPGVQNAVQLLQDLTSTVCTAGTRLGPYLIESKLGEGGMGQVFRAVDTRLGRAVAIKITHQQFSSRSIALHRDGSQGRQLGRYLGPSELGVVLLAFLSGDGSRIRAHG